MLISPLEKLFWVLLVLGIGGIVPAFVAIGYLGDLPLDRLVYLCLCYLIIMVPTLLILSAIAVKKINHEIVRP